MHPPEIQYAVVLLAAGSGQRFNAPIPKQFLTLAGKPVVQHSLELFLSQKNCTTIILVLPATRNAPPLPGWVLAHPKVRIISGGETRQDSVRLGLEALSGHEWVLIHDAARPLLNQQSLDALLSALPDSNGAILGHPVTDTLKQTTETGEILTTLERGHLWAAQTPQAFRLHDILLAHQRFRDGTFSDDAALGELSGLNLRLVHNPHPNPKITWSGDLTLCEALLAQQTPKKILRIGYGVDIHQFYPGDGVTLGGIFIPHDKKLQGHSDADAVLHAVTDALLGALGEADIGVHFPPNDPQWKGVASNLFVTAAMQKLRAQGGHVVNADITVIAEAPRLAPHREAIISSIAKLLGVSNNAVAVKATTAERLGAFGRGEGLYACATILVEVSP
jgi:2-C-methyl-D-erythritol 4-phosphate cytidylyltransferase/2-C-methyl-D-erythritol 2,4-cyclodiphosphate synthase